MSLDIVGLKLADWIPATSTVETLDGDPGLKMVDWSPASTEVHNVDGTPFVDQMIVSSGIRGPAGVVVIDADQEFPPEGTPIGTIVFKRLE